MDHLTSTTSASSGATVWLAAAALLLTTAALTALQRQRKTRSSSSSNAGAAAVAAAPPVLRGAALVRFARAVARDGPLEAMREQQDKLGSVFTASLLGLLKVTFLVGPEVSSHFYLAPDSEISQGNLYEFTVPIFGPDVAYAVDLHTRNEQTRFYWDVLKPRSMKANVAAMAEEVENYFWRWGDEGTVDLKQELEQVLMLIAGRCLLGREVRERMLGEVFDLYRDLDNGTRLISTLLPYLPTPAHRRRDRAHRRLRDIFTEAVRSRRNSGRDGSTDDDVLQRFIDSRYKIDGRPMTDAEIVGLLIALVFAGKHTSAGTSTWIGAHLLSDSNQKHLAAAVDEQDQLTAAARRDDGAGQHRPRGGVDHDAIQQMTALHRCIKEVLRLHPPVVAMVRQARSDFTVQTREGEKYTIPAGHTVMSTILVNHHLPHIYRDPHAFDPQRFAPGREEDKAAGPFSFLSFSAGRHACAGESFAYTQIKVIWSHLLRNFELKMVSPFPGTNWSAVVPEPKGKVIVSYRRRANNTGAGQ
ncbi:obtusifoliol 14-alpha demethylase-like [Oryza brachyantha]|uniref:Obtusifoliol 14-alpha demethylase n=1 Tax=Oryza brachyantha TaxID=4533 RepID=J3MKN5_ORYBR|nr:obtusifoliol 14-alpha demethylase-like [Oryza brachyantha]